MKTHVFQLTAGDEIPVNLHGNKIHFVDGLKEIDVRILEGSTSTDLTLYEGELFKNLNEQGQLVSFSKFYLSSDTEQEVKIRVGSADIKGSDARIVNAPEIAVASIPSRVELRNMTLNSFIPATPSTWHVIGPSAGEALTKAKITNVTDPLADGAASEIYVSFDNADNLQTGRFMTLKPGEETTINYNGDIYIFTIIGTGKFRYSADFIEL